MMPSDLDVARLCQAIYDTPQAAGFDHLWTNGLAFVGHKKFDNTDCIIWRGSFTGLDWLEDLEAVPANWPGLGTVHAGFLGGVLWDKARVDAVCGKSVIVGGHSLGAAHAQIYAAMRVADGKPVDRVVVMGSPRPACGAMRDLLAAVPLANYRNVGDPVTDVPTFPFLEMRPFTDIHEAPLATDTSPFAHHHINLYCSGIASLKA